MKARPVQQSLIDPTLERPVGPLPMSVVRGNNAQLIASIAELYLTGSVLDVTYGLGKWWDRYRPTDFTYHDLETVDGVDFRHLPELDNSFDAVCFDPPYVPAGGVGSTTTNKVAHFRKGFGIDREVGYGAESELFELIKAGLVETARVTRQWLLIKCMEFTSSRQFHDMPTQVTLWCRELGLTKHDVIVHASGSGPGGHNIFEPIRARRAHSYMLVFRKAGAPEVAA